MQPRLSEGAGLAPLVQLLPSEMPGLPAAVSAALREVEADAMAYRNRGALLGYEATMRAARKIAARLRVDVYVDGPSEFEVTR